MSEEQQQIEQQKDALTKADNTYYDTLLQEENLKQFTAGIPPNEIKRDALVQFSTEQKIAPDVSDEDLNQLIITQNELSKIKAERLEYLRREYQLQQNINLMNALLMNLNNIELRRALFYSLPIDNIRYRRGYVPSYYNGPYPSGYYSGYFDDYGYPSGYAGYPGYAYGRRPVVFASSYYSPSYPFYTPSIYTYYHPWFYWLFYGLAVSSLRTRYPYWSVSPLRRFRLCA